jgi:hypothetical protein
MIPPKKFFKMADSIIAKWRKILHVDPIWKIHTDIIDDAESPALARIDTSNAEYYAASIEFSENLLSADIDIIMPVIEEVVSHEIIHLVLLEFFRTAQIAAGKNQVIHRELLYKYEQFTSRLQKAFCELEEKVRVKGIALDALHQRYLKLYSELNEKKSTIKNSKEDEEK